MQLGWPITSDCQIYPISVGHHRGLKSKERPNQAILKGSHIGHIVRNLEFLQNIKMISEVKLLQSQS